MLSNILLVAVLVLLAAACGGGLGWLSQRLARQSGRQHQLIEQINAQLPQLQCGDCGYSGCRPYAAAIAAGSAGIALCPPGGSATAKRLAALLNVTPPPMPVPPRQRIAVINAQDCVGCALCLPACPTDAIIGAPRHTHVVETANCVGCELCLPPCPVDCIRMVDAD